MAYENRLDIIYALNYSMFMVGKQRGERKMKATIEISERILISLVNNDLDSSQKHEIMGYLWEIARKKGFCDEQGNPTGKAKI